MADVIFPDGTLLSTIPRGIPTFPTRALNTVYQNTSGRPIVAMVSLHINTIEVSFAYALIGDVSPPTTYVGSIYHYHGGLNYTVTQQLIFIIPNNYYYEITSSGTPVIVYWVEY